MKRKKREFVSFSHILSKNTAHISWLNTREKVMKNTVDHHSSWYHCMSDQLWRLQNLYWIENKRGQVQRFTMNTAQLRLHHELWFRNDILKARQLGISTYAALLMLDLCLFSSNYHCGIIDKTLPDAQQKLAKIRFAWESLDYIPPSPTKTDIILAQLGRKVKESTGVIGRLGELKFKTDARTCLTWSNGSDVRIGTNLRGGTFQFLHVSELGYVSVHSPKRAQDIRTGAINTVPPDGYILKESTHEGGRSGVNYELTRVAMENGSKSVLSPLDFKFFFFSWFDNSEYALHREEDDLSLKEYFERLARQDGIILTPAQRAWYSRMSKTMGVGMRQEYPSTPYEAFIAGEDGSIYGEVLQSARHHGRLGVEFDVAPDSRLFTSWDLGMSDHTAIWLIQPVGTSFHWIDHYSTCKQALHHYVQVIAAWERKYGAIATHFLPHDAAKRDALGSSYVEHLARECVTNVRVVPRISDIWQGINALRSVLERSIFHSRTLQPTLDMKGNNLPSPLEHLELYRSQPPGVFGALKETPIHDSHSHTADAARTFAEAQLRNLLTPINIVQLPKRARM